MPTIASEIRIAAPPSAVTGVLLDAGLAPAWTAGLDRLELVEGEPGAVGCVGRAVYIEGGREHAFSDILEVAVPERHYRSRVTGGGIEAIVDTTLEPTADDSTRVRFSWTGNGQNPLTKLMLPLMKGRIAKRMQADMRSLRDLVERTNRLQV